jgi:hypothetical protein
MKKKIIVLLLALGLLVPTFAYAKGEWSDWWFVGRMGAVKRIYDHENKLVCWIYDGNYSGGISCQPSLELEHPTGRGVTE